MKSNKLTVANGIMDPAASEYLSTNLADVEAVQQYAKGGLDIDLTEEEAEKVLLMCKSMQSRMDAGEIPTTDEWYNDFEKPLSQTKGEKIAELIRSKARRGAEYVTYGDGDLGVPIPIFDAIVDFESMEDDLIGEGTWFVCDETGKIIE
jgi:hypothetical protein